MRKKEKLIFVRNRWEFASIEANPETGKAQWIRRDSSYICDVGDETAHMDAPAAPLKAIAKKSV